MRVNVDSSKVCRLLGYVFRGWDDTITATVDALLEVGGVKPV